MDINDIKPALEAILFASGDPMPAARIARVLGADENDVFAAAKALTDEYAAAGRGIRLVRLDGSLQLCSAPEYASEVAHALEQRRAPRLSASALEVLAIAAYFQPVTRAYIDQVRGVDSSYTVGVLTERGLLEPCGRLEVPGRPTVYRTSEAFLRVMGISSLEELPELPDMTTDEGIVTLQNKIDALQSEEIEGQMTLTGD